MAELAIAISLLGILAVGIWSTDNFIHHQLICATRRTEIQNELSFIIDHMTKRITGAGQQGGAIGDYTNESDVWESAPIRTEWPGDGVLIKIYIDRNANGKRDAGDIRIAYRYVGAPSPNAYQLWYYPRCDGQYCTNASGDNDHGVLSYRIRDLNFYGETHYWPWNNYLPITMQGCWDPDNSPLACGTYENPSIKMTARIMIPGASVH